ncbi:hypothetical protein ACOXH8_45620 [Nannocystis pusilla]
MVAMDASNSGCLALALGLVACAPQSREIMAFGPTLQMMGGAPELSLIGLELHLKEGDRQVSVEYGAGAVLTFRGAELAPGAKLHLRAAGPRKGHTAVPPSLPLLRAVAETRRADGAATGLVALLQKHEGDVLETAPMAWEPALGSAPPLGYVVTLGASEGGTLVHLRPSEPALDRVIGWSPDVGARFTLAPGFPADWPTACPLGTERLTSGSAGSLRVAPSGRFAVFARIAGAYCTAAGTTTSTRLDELVEATVFDTRTGQAIAAPVQVRGAKLRHESARRAAVTDDGELLVSLPGDEDAGTEPRWSVHAADGAQVLTFPMIPDAWANEVFAWDDGWLLRTEDELVALARDGTEKRRAPLAADAPIVVTRDALFVLEVEAAEDPDLHFPGERPCLHRHDATLSRVATSCLENEAIAAAFDRG